MLMRFVLLTFLALTVLGGCRHRDGRGTTSASTAPTVNGRRLNRLLSIASRDLSCPVAGLAHEQVTDRIYRVRGCNDWRDYAIFGGRRHRAARWRRIVPISDRASADFSCPMPQMTFTPSTPLSYGVVGCGKAAGYDLRCTETDCGWVGGAPPSGTATASLVIIVPATTAPLSIDIDGEADDDGE